MSTVTPVTFEALESRLLLDATPNVLSVSINDGAAQRATIQSISISFDKDVSASLAPGDLVLHNNTTGADVVISGATVNFDHAWDIARWDLSHTPLPDGNYTATLAAGSVADPLGNALANDYKFSLYKYYGDNDGTRTTDTTDLFALRNTYLKASGDAGYSAAFDSDGDGDVDSVDLFQFRSNYTHSLTAPTTNLLMVDNGNGDGQYAANATVTVTAAAAPPGKVFNMWVGDILGGGYINSTLIGSATSATTTFKMPAGATRIVATYRDAAAPVDWFPKTDLFNKATFGAQKEPLAYQFFGNTLAFQADGEFTRPSETSAFLAFETNLPAKTYIEYGTTTSYGQYSQQLAQYTYLHNYSLMGLTTGITYHYRLVAQDERGNILTSADKTFTTATPANVIYLPGGHITSTLTLSQTGKTYVLTGDLVADETAFTFTANNITLDLGGHTVIYDNNAVQQVSGAYLSSSAMGVRATSRTGVNVYNGKFVQGASYSHGDTDCTGYSGLYMQSCTGEVAGVTVEYSGKSVSGMYLNYSTLNVHFNTVIDHGGDMFDRMQGESGIFNDSNSNHNQLLRVRQNGVTGVNNGVYYDNEIYVDACSTNSFALNFYKINGAHIYGNRVFGTGYLLVGIATVSASSNIEANNNFVHLQAIEPDNRWPEYGAQCGEYGVRITWGGSNLNYHDNVFSVYGRDGGQIRGVWPYTQSAMTNVNFTNNTIQTILQNGQNGFPTTRFGAVDVTGDGTTYPLTTYKVIFTGNRIVSNYCNAILGDEYGEGNNSLFLNNTFVKSPLYPRTDYTTLYIGWYNQPASNHQFFDSTFEGGASYSSYAWDGYTSTTQNFYVGWTLTVMTTPGATVSIKDKTGATVFTGTADATGKAQTRLYQYKNQRSSGITYYTDHTVTISKTGLTTQTATVTMDATKTLTLLLS